ncbi:MAG: SAM-dependent DNA methyltransferase [Candidatus Cloacimonadota bacterium]|nr:MAG: SAM-dependent DNA methyltransferase [Candidatus Cloacimonadota bacterium]
MIKKWIEKRYTALWEEFKDMSFKFDEARKVLKDALKDDKKQVNVILSELRKANMLTADFDKEDARKRIYRLKSQKEIVSQILAVDKSRLTRADLERLLKKAADLIRTRVDYTFILIMLFYKRISDKWEKDFEESYQEALEDGLNEREAKQEAKASTYHDFDIPGEFLWKNMRKVPGKLPENFSKAMKIIAERNPELKDVFENIDFVQFTTSSENAEILRQLVELFSMKSLHNVSPDILGDAYEWILRYFAPQKAKEGEVYTPREVIKLIVKILDPKPQESVYDPSLGSGGMLIMSYKHVEDKYGTKEADKLFLLGQEVNPKTLAIAKMNLYIHGIRNALLTFGDTLLYPKFKEGEGVKTFDMVIANPPWNQDGYNEEVIKKGEFWKERFRYGPSTKQSADWVWIQHMLASAKNDTGRIGVVIDNGCLFRGGKEKAIRTEILRDDLIETVILLPEKLFYNTGAPGAIIVLNKNKPKKRKNNVLYINASGEYEQHPDIRKLNRLGDEHIKKVVNVYKRFKEIEGFSRIISFEEIRENDYNLNVTLYVFPEEEVEEIDIAKEWKELNGLEKEIDKTTKKLAQYLEELKY